MSAANIKRRCGREPIGTGHDVAFRETRSVRRRPAPSEMSAPPLNHSTAPEISAPVVVPSARPSVPSHPTSEETSRPIGEPSNHRDVSWVWDVPFDRIDMAGAIERIDRMIQSRRPGYAITANLNYAMLNHRHGDMPAITRGASLIMADGQPIVWRSRLTGKPLPERVAGSELIFRLAETAAEKSWRVFLLGGEPGIARRCGEILADRYAGLQIVGTECPPFRPATEEETEALVHRVRDTRPDILLVAFGQPKGERWIAEHVDALQVPVCMQIGASFDFVVGKSQRAPKIFQRLGCEWLHRMMSDPKRLVPRYAGNIAFLAGALIRDWRKKVRSWGMDVS